jgi:hypothetical protein
MKTIPIFGYCLARSEVPGGRIAAAIVYYKNSKYAGEVSFMNSVYYAASVCAALYAGMNTQMVGSDWFKLCYPALTREIVIL